LRHAEILGLDWDRHVDFEAREIRLLAGETKNGEGRSLPFTDEAEVLLREQRARVVAQLGRLTECCFPVLHGAFVRAWATATKAAGVPELLFHDLRRTAIRNLVRAGVSQKVAQEISGHKSATVFARYNITSADDRRDAMKKVTAFHGGTR
jgi:integrase